MTYLIGMEAGKKYNPAPGVIPDYVFKDGYLWVWFGIGPDRGNIKGDERVFNRGSWCYKMIPWRGFKKGKISDYSNFKNRKHA